MQSSNCARQLVDAPSGDCSYTTLDAEAGPPPDVADLERQATPLRPKPFRQRSAKPATRGADDPTLTRYFDDVARIPLLKPEQESEMARAIERSEVEHWMALLSFAPVAEVIVATLTAHVTRVQEIETPLLEEVGALVREAKHAPLTGEAARHWPRRVEQLTRGIRRWDTERAWMAQATTIARSLERGPVAMNDVTRRGARAPLPQEQAAYLERVERTFVCHRELKAGLVRANLRLVVTLAGRYGRGGFALIDLIQEGNLGLMKAVERFEVERGYRFATFAAWWIRAAMWRAIGETGHEVRIPIHLLAALSRSTRARRVIVARTGEEPALEELSLASRVSPAELARVQDLPVGLPLSLDTPIGDTEDHAFVDSLQYEDAISPLDHVVTQANADALRVWLGALTGIERAVLRARFGLDDQEEATLAQVALVHDRTREGIRRVQERALSKLRKRLANTEDRCPHRGSQGGAHERA